jgi:hypothetical protein
MTRKYFELIRYQSGLEKTRGLKKKPSPVGFLGFFGYFWMVFFGWVFIANPGTNTR